MRSIQLIPRPTPLPGMLSDWLETFAESFLHALSPECHQEFFQEVQDSLAETLRDPEGCWSVDYVRLRFSAVKIAS